MFIPAYLKQTDRLTDITYSLTFILIATIGFYFSSRGIFDIVLLLMITAWALRLGLYLFNRIGQMGHDSRFDEMRPHWNRYIKFWLLQGMSVWVISLPIIIAFSNKNSESLHWISILGFILWFAGFGLEWTADAQKSRAKRIAPNEFVSKGVYSLVRFPNYTGEIMVWIGVFLYVIPILQGLQWISIISPLWIIILLIWISGIPFVQRSQEKKYGSLPSYREYVGKTKKLIPGIY